MSTQAVSAFDTNKIQLLDARILTFEVGGTDGLYVSAEEVQSVSFVIESEEFFDAENQFIRIILKVKASAETEIAGQENQTFDTMGKFHIGFVFNIENYDDLITETSETEKQITVDDILIRHVFAIAYATARGMILVKTRGTSLDGCILPIVDPGTLMEKNAKGQG